jgi:hypothetical protein
MDTKLRNFANLVSCVAGPLLALLGLSSFALSQMTQAQTIDDVVAKILEARGGLEKTKAVQTERISGTVYFNPETYGPFVAEFKRPGKMHNEVTIENKTVIRVFNGKDAGWEVNPFMGKDTPVAMSAEELKDVATEADFDGPIVDAKAKGNTLELAGMDKVEGHDVYAVKVTHKNGKVSSYFYDAKTYLLAKWSGTESVNGESITRETYFHEYRDVQGLKFPFELISNNSATDVVQRILVDKVEIDPQIDDSHFGKPAVPSAASASLAAASVIPLAAPSAPVLVSPVRATTLGVPAPAAQAKR